MLSSVGDLGTQSEGFQYRWTDLNTTKFPNLRHELPPDSVPYRPDAASVLDSAFTCDLSRRLEQIPVNREKSTPEPNFRDDIDIDIIEPSHRWICQSLRKHFKPFEAEIHRSNISDCGCWELEARYYSDAIKSIMWQEACTVTGVDYLRDLIPTQDYWQLEADIYENHVARRNQRIPLVVLHLPLLVFLSCLAGLLCQVLSSTYLSLPTHLELLPPFLYLVSARSSDDPQGWILGSDNDTVQCDIQVASSHVTGVSRRLFRIDIDPITTDPRIMLLKERGSLRMRMDDRSTIICDPLRPYTFDGPVILDLGPVWFRAWPPTRSHNEQRRYKKAVAELSMSMLEAIPKYIMPLNAIEPETATENTRGGKNNAYVTDRVVSQRGSSSFVIMVRERKSGNIFVAKEPNYKISDDPARLRARAERNSRTSWITSFNSTIIDLVYHENISFPPWLIMEYIPDDILQAEVQEDEVPIVLLHINSALVHLHHHGVTHRDLKPSNILIKRHQHGLTAKLPDFGTAENGIRGIDAFTRSPTYMAPELFDLPQKWLESTIHAADTSASFHSLDDKCLSSSADGCLSWLAPVIAANDSNQIQLEDGRLSLEASDNGSPTEIGTEKDSSPNVDERRWTTRTEHPTLSTGRAIAAVRNTHLCGKLGSGSPVQPHYNAVYSRPSAVDGYSMPDTGSPTAANTMSVPAKLPSISPKSQWESIKLSPEEVASGTTTFEHIQLGVEQYHKNGFIVIENAIPHHILDQFNERMIAESDISLKWPRVQYNHGVQHKNISQTPPLSAPFIHEEVWANRHAITVLENIIGPRPELSFISSNIALPGGVGRQAVHSDAYHQHLDCPFSIEIYIFLTDASAENGATEIWLGTHEGYNKKDHIPHERGWIPKKLINERALISPPIQPTVPKGSICMRDLRLWHAGMLNHTPDPRVMLAFIYFPQWYRSFMHLTLPKECRPIIESWKHVKVNAEYVDGERVKMNFTQIPNKGLFESRVETDDKMGKPKDVDLEITEENYWIPIQSED
ncbi:hypothetical protein B7494_g5203 [Chlorociboria aeruginascens]|nr:hypothetical protein B7494_g5203 [Chlorociboria aeruginascens]